MRFMYPRRFRLESVQIKMERKAIQRLNGQVVISERLCGIDGVLVRVVFGVDDVGDYALRQRAADLRRERDSALRAAESGRYKKALTA